MARSKKVVLEFEAKTSQVTQSVEAVESSVEGLSSSVDKLTGGMVSGFRSGVAGARKMAMGMKTLRAAIISTGVGALVIAITSVITAISRLQGVQDKYKQFTAGLGAVLDVLGDTLAYVGKAIIDAFSSPKEALDSFLSGVQSVWGWLQQLNTLIIGSVYKSLLQIKEGFLNAAVATKEFFGGDATELKKELDETKAKIDIVAKAVEESKDKIAEPFEAAAKAVGEYVDKLTEAGEAAAALERAEQRLADIRISQTVNQAKRNKELAEARLIAEDEAKSFDERTEALKRAIELENQNLAEQLANAREEARIIKERNSLAESSREDRQREAEALAKVYELEAASIRQQRRVFTRLQAIKKQEAAQAKKLRDEEVSDLANQQKILDDINKQILEDTASQYEKEILAVEDKYNALLDRAQQYDLDTVQLEEAREAKLDEIRKKYAKEDVKTTEITAKQKAQIAMSAAKALGNLINALGSNTEQGARRRFAINKALGIADATVNTALAVTDALAKDGTGVPLSRFAAAATAGIQGAAQIATIARTKFQSSGGGGGGVSVPSTPSGGGGQSPVTAPTLDFSFLEQGANQSAIQSYVLSTDVSNSMEATQLIQDQAKL